MGDPLGRELAVSQGLRIAQWLISALLVLLSGYYQLQGFRLLLERGRLPSDAMPRWMDE
jgi:hypothetical protein